MSRVPNGCLEPYPTTQSVLFCGWFINLSHISLHTGIGLSSVSRVFSGKRQPTLKNTKKIAEALKMSIEDFILALEDHIGPMEKYGEANKHHKSSDGVLVPTASVG